MLICSITEEKSVESAKSVVKKLKEVIASLVLRTGVKPLPCWWSPVPRCIWLNFFNYWILNYFRKLNDLSINFSLPVKRVPVKRP